MQNSSDKIELKKDQIKTAALRCFSQYGFNKTTMDDIANSIGMKKASLYYYYKNKEAVFCEMIESEVKTFISKAEEKVSNVKSATNKLFLLVKLETEYFQEKVGTFDLSVSTIIEAQPILNETMEKVRRKDVDLWAKVINEGIDKGEFRKCNAKKIADTIRTVLDSIKFREFQISKVFSAADIDYNKIKRTGKEMIDLIINGLKKC
jgi:AcrR family transcriptional regulator